MGDGFERIRLHLPSHPGESASDWLAARAGSWGFIIIFLVFLLGWIALNTWILTHPFDAPPYIGLNLLLSFVAGFQAPVILMSQNRQATKDRKRDDLEAREIEVMFQEHREQRQALQEILTLLRERTPKEVT